MVMTWKKGTWLSLVCNSLKNHSGEKWKQRKWVAIINTHKVLDAASAFRLELCFIISIEIIKPSSFFRFFFCPEHNCKCWASMWTLERAFNFFPFLFRFKIAHCTIAGPSILFSPAPYDDGFLLSFYWISPEAAFYIFCTEESLLFRKRCCSANDRESG